MGLFHFETKTIKDLKKRAKSGDRQAQYKLALAYSSGSGVTQNQKKAVEYCVEAADGLYPPAQALLAHFYGFGKGVEKNYEEMVRWGEKSAVQGYALSQYNMGRCYELGIGKEKDMEKAIRWYTLAAEQGRPDAAYKLGQIYEQGLGVAVDLKKAEEWYEKAAGDQPEDAGTPPVIAEDNRKYKCLSELKVGEGFLMKENDLLESPYVLVQAENHETELGWGKAKAICNTASLISLTTGKKRTSILYCDAGNVNREALKAFQDQVDSEYGEEAVAWHEPHRRIPIILKNVKYVHKHNTSYRMQDLETQEVYEMQPQGWAVPILDKLDYDTVVTIAYYEGNWYFVRKKASEHIGCYKFCVK